MEQGASPTLRLWQLAESLRGYRERAKLTIEEAGSRLHPYSARWSRSKVQRIETRMYTPKPNEVEHMCAAYDVPSGETAMLVGMAHEARQKGWWQSSAIPKRSQTLIGLEQSATTVRQFELALMPGLLQTSDYARALMSALDAEAPIEITENKVAARMTRQQVLKGSKPAELRVVMSEAVLRCPVGGDRVMRGQLERLMDTQHESNVSVQVMPFEQGPHPGMEGSFTLLTLPALESDIVYTEGPQGVVCLESKDEVRKCTMRFAVLSSKALSPSVSMELISSILAKYQ